MVLRGFITRRERGYRSAIGRYAFKCPYTRVARERCPYCLRAHNIDGRTTLGQRVATRPPTLQPLTSDERLEAAVVAYPAEIRAPSEEQTMKMVAEHAKSAHGIKEITPEIAAKMRSVMQDDAS
jgi:predicted small metal-binding protein